MLYDRFLDDNTQIDICLDIQFCISLQDYNKYCSMFNVTRFFDLPSKILILLYNKHCKERKDFSKKSLPLEYLVNDKYSGIYFYYTHKRDKW